MKIIFKGLILFNIFLFELKKNFLSFGNLSKYFIFNNNINFIFIVRDNKNMHEKPKNMRIYTKNAIRTGS
jgi:hypothetical protein